MIIAYAIDNNVGRFLVINLEVSDIGRNTIIEARDVVYFENIFPLKSVICATPSVPLTFDSSSRSIPVEEPRRNKRGRVEKT